MDCYIDIYTLNDFHGALFAEGDEPGISRLGNFLLLKRREATTVILSAGDMFQGTAVSSLCHGDVVVDAMNYIGFDAMTIGNHEFDWGIENLRRLTDGDTANNEAGFPILGANIIYKETGEPVEWARPYAVIERQDIKIGIIGVLGADLTNDILGSIIAEYEFIDPLPVIKKHSRFLRGELGCQVVIVVAHADTTPINGKIAFLPAEEKVDAIVNGHTHNYYAGETPGIGGVMIPYIQSGNNGKYIGHIRLYYDRAKQKVIDVDCENIPANLACRDESEEINALLSNYQDLIDIAKAEIAIAGVDIDRQWAASWVAEIIKKHADADLGVINIGGIRDAAFPITKGEPVTYGRVFRMTPFENKIVTVELKGNQLREIIARPAAGKLVFSSNFDAASGLLEGKKLKAGEYYLTATVDFVLEAPVYQMLAGRKIDYSDIKLRDLLVGKIAASASRNNGFWQT